MAATVFAEFGGEAIAPKKCSRCRSTDRVKSVQIVRKGGKRKNTVQIHLCYSCRYKLQKGG
jgi:hypothetical protein